MKKIKFIIVSILIFSCTQENDNLIEDSNILNSQQKSTKDVVLSKSTINYYVMNASSTYRECDPNYPAITGNIDVEIQFSQPLEYDTSLSFSLKSFKKNAVSGIKHDFVSEIPNPWIFVQAKAGDKKIVLNASCELPLYIKCGDGDDEPTEIKSKNFRIKLENAEYNELGVQEVLIYSPDPNFNKDYYDTTAYFYCLGSGWNPPNHDPDNPGGVN